MFGNESATLLSLAIALLGLAPLALAFAEQPGLLRGTPDRPGNRVIGLLGAGRRA